MPRNIRITRVFRSTRHVVDELQRLHLSRFRASPSAWEPAVDAFRCDETLELCVELAGVPRDQVRLEVESRRIVIIGLRPAPEQSRSELANCRQVLALEIDRGPFSRTLNLPFDVDPDNVSAEQDNGMLWIRLPIKRA